MQAAILPLALAGCRAGTPVATGCASTIADPVAYSKVDLGYRANSVPYADGPELRAVARSDSEWTRTWHTVADSLAEPRVNLRDSIVVIVASREFADGPAELEIEDVHRCRGDSMIVVSVRMHEHEMKNDYGARTIRAVELSRGAADGRVVRFLDLPTVRDR